MRRSIPILLIAATFLAALSASASDFWFAKDWHQWSAHECSVLLAESPWTHTWRAGPEFRRIDPDPGTTGIMSGPDGGQMIYIVQLRSSLPLRQALIRRQQLQLNYDKMNGDEQKAFDAKTAKILDRSYDDAILVHVDFSRTTGRGGLVMQNKELAQKPERLHALLVTEDGFELRASRLDPNLQDATFDAIFPRTVNGVPVVQDGQKRFSIQFQGPSSQPVRVDFDLSKMLVNGKPNF
jgi:hypothetical protein